MMKIDLDDRHTIITDRWGYPVLITHKAGVPAVDDKGKQHGHALYFRTYGQAVRSYISMKTPDTDINTFPELAAFIDSTLKEVEFKIDQQMEAISND